MLALLAALALALPSPNAPSAQPDQDQAEAESSPLQRLLTAIRIWSEDGQSPNERDFARADSQAQKAVDEFLSDPGETELEGFNELVVGLYRTSRYEDCLRIARAGIGAFEEPFGMHEYAGLSEMVLAQESEAAGEMLAHAQAALDSLLAARKLNPDSPPPQIYLPYAYSMLGQFDLALAEFDALKDSSPYKNKLSSQPHFSRGRLLLGAGRYAEAHAELTHADEATEPLADRNVYLLARCLALTGRPADAVEMARGLWERDPSEESLALLADSLAYDGKAEQALALLNDTSIMLPGLDEEERSAIEESRLVTKHLISLGGKRSPDLRAELTAILDHNFVISGAPGADGGDLDLAGSPRCMAYLTRQVPWSQSSWCNDLLFVLCVEDAIGYEPGPIEKALTSQLMDAAMIEALDGLNAKQRSLELLSMHRLMPDTTCVLTIERLLK